MALIPLEDRVLVKPAAEEKTTKSGFILPDNKKEQPSKWKIIAVGKGKITDDGERAPMDVKVWDTVYFTKYAPDEIEIEEKGEKVTYLVIAVDSILAKEG